MTLDEIQAVFFQECEEGVAAAETALLALKAGDRDGETINTIFRAVHSIKGGAGAFAFAALQSFTHHFETLLDKVRDGELAVTPTLADLLMAAFDILVDHVAAAREGSTPPPDEAMVAALQDALAGDVAHAPASATGDGLSFDLAAMMADTLAVAEEASEWTLSFTPTREDLANGGEPLLLIREILSLGGRIERVDVSRLPTLDQFEADAAWLGWTIAIPGTVEESAICDVFDFVADPASVRLVRGEEDAGGASFDEPSSPIAPPAPVAPVATVAPPTMPSPSLATTPSAPSEPRAATTAPAMIRVDLEKLDRLVDLVGELVITQAMLSQRLSSHGMAAAEELADIDQLTRELQDSAMAIRAQPVKSVFSRVPRIVRELEASTGKRVMLEVEGEATELDKTVIERIGEPLTHLVRNCIDHGIELPADRVARGKPAEGRLRLAAEHKGSRIVISVSDDGAGIDRARVLAVAVERGIVAPDARLTDDEIDQLIFAPGFSTARTVSNISGRGVGMDVVRQNVQGLGGRISIQSMPGAGSTFALALPLTLAIVDGMIVRVADQTYIIPLTHVVESLRPETGAVQRTGFGTSVLNVRGAFLPVLSVAEQLHVRGGVTEPSEAVLIVVETENSGTAILMVDAIVDQRQVVIKSLETHYQQVDGVAGATILGDGHVALILDVEGIVALRGSMQWLKAS
ncbi:two-component system chemotaxis sensor kinase CheA [Sphingomonas jinjuensis]|uniref:Chemotaxis protein CheA n=1 Tax=Sphingomonas jinjuensis TaxID=535907 RepID=A0A840FBR0_9SPHN|nr:two-component system chemotaxis sensor kinase CheA [Sphingomonas jinjuensis]